MGIVSDRTGPFDAVRSRFDLNDLRADHFAVCVEYKFPLARRGIRTVLDGLDCGHGLAAVRVDNDGMRFLRQVEQPLGQLHVFLIRFFGGGLRGSRFLRGACAFVVFLFPGLGGGVRGFLHAFRGLLRGGRHFFRAFRRFLRAVGPVLIVLPALLHVRHVRQGDLADLVQVIKPLLHVLPVGLGLAAVLHELQQFLIIDPQFSGVVRGHARFLTVFLQGVQRLVEVGACAVPVHAQGLQALPDLVETETGHLAQFHHVVDGELHALSGLLKGGDHVLPGGVHDLAALPGQFLHQVDKAFAVFLFRVAEDGGPVALRHGGVDPGEAFLTVDLVEVKSAPGHQVFRRGHRHGAVHAPRFDLRGVRRIGVLIVLEPLVLLWGLLHRLVERLFCLRRRTQRLGQVLNGLGGAVGPALETVGAAVFLILLGIIDQIGEQVGELNQDLLIGPSSGYGVLVICFCQFVQRRGVHFGGFLVVSVPFRDGLFHAGDLVIRVHRDDGKVRGCGRVRVHCGVRLFISGRHAAEGFFSVIIRLKICDGYAVFISVNPEFVLQTLQIFVLTNDVLNVIVLGKRCRKIIKLKVSKFFVFLNDFCQCFRIVPKVDGIHCGEHDLSLFLIEQIHRSLRVGDSLCQRFHRQITNAVSGVRGLFCGHPQCLRKRFKGGGIFFRPRLCHHVGGIQFRNLVAAVRGGLSLRNGVLRGFVDLRVMVLDNFVCDADRRGDSGRRKTKPTYIRRDGSGVPSEHPGKQRTDAL